MVQDFTKVGMHNEQPETPDPLRDAVRIGVKRQTGWAGLRVGIDKLTGATHKGIDAPNKTLRKAIGGGWELLYVLKYGFGALLFLLMGLLFFYGGVANPFKFDLLGYGLGSLVLAALFAHWALRAAKNLRSIAKA